MKILVTPLILSIVASCGAVSLRGNGERHLEKLEGSCVVLEREDACAGKEEGELAPCDGEVRQFACAASDGRIYALDTDLVDLAKGNRPAFTIDAGADILQSATTVFSGDADIDTNTGRISFVRGNFSKAKGSPGNGGNPFDRRLLTGEKRVLAIKVVTSDAVTTSYDTSFLSDSVFGTAGDTVNLASQYTECSHGQLNFVPKPDGSSSLGTVTASSGGVTTVTVASDSTCGDTSAGLCRDQAISAVQTAFGTKGGADYAMVCVPSVSMNGIAYAYINWWISVYKDTWCTFPSAQLHELGHNINLAHSGEGTDQYGDQSGFMGYSYSQDDQKMCFNGPKNWQLGWFSDRHVTLTAGVDSWSGRLYGQTVYDTTSSAEKMIVRLTSGTTNEDVYVSFNHDALHNINTAEGQNRVLVHNKAGAPTAYAQSWLRAKLAAGSTYTTTDGTPTPITVNAINTAEGWADVTIGDTSTPAPVPPTPPPSDAPTKSPTPGPTASPVPPTPPPTDAPTMSPTTAQPTTSPTPSPTGNPTVCPLAKVNQSCEIGADCCSGSCSGGRKADRVCLATGPVTPAPVGSPTTPQPSGGCPPPPTNGDECNNGCQCNSGVCKGNGTCK